MFDYLEKLLSAWRPKPKPIMTYDKLKGAIPDFVYNQIASIQNLTLLRLAHFISQCYHESMGFKATVENLNYSAEALMKVFPKYFPDINLAQSCARQPEKIGNIIYSNRMGNGPNEGYRYRGRGFIQLTGKNNYSAFSKYIKEDCVANPDLVSMKYPLASAAFFFEANGIWPICDTGTVTDVTKKINGGTIGLVDREAQFKRFKEMLCA